MQLGMLMAVRPCRPISQSVATRRRCLRDLPICLTLLETRLLVMGLLRFLRFRRLRPVPVCDGRCSCGVAC